MYEGLSRGGNLDVPLESEQWLPIKDIGMPGYD